MKRLLPACALLLAGCLDFTAAKLSCYDAGICERDLGDPPTLISHTPQTDATGVAPSTPILLNFSRAMDPASLEVQLTPPDALAPAEWDDEHLSVVLVPAVPLRYATTYTVRVSGIADDDRVPLKATSFTYTTKEAPDMSAPTLASSNPVNAMMNAALSTKLQLAFSEPMNPESLRLTNNPDFNWGTPVWTSNNQTATFSSPPSTLQPLTTYAVSVEGEDVSGNSLTGTRTIVFTTAAAADTVKPIVVSTSPAGGSTDVSPNTNISISFSEPMQASVTGAVTVTPTIALSCALDVAGVLLTCSHAAAFAGGTMYRVKVAGANALDLAGNAMASDAESTFTTGTAADTTKPTVLSFTPTAGSKSETYFPQMTVKFSEAMDPAATQAAIVVTSPANVTGTYTWKSATEVTFKPTPPSNYGFAPQTKITWQIGSGAKDLAGNTLAATMPLEFTVRRRVSINVVGLPADGALYESGTTKVATTTSTTFAVGDNAANGQYRGFLFFDLSVVPQNALGIYEAKLQVNQYSTLGTPFGLGNVLGESIPYATPLAAPSWNSAADHIPCELIAPSFPGLACAFSPGGADTFTLSSNATAGARTVYIEGWVSKALAARKLALRLRFTNGEDNDGAIDLVYFSSADSTTNKPTIALTYEVPAP